MPFASSIAVAPTRFSTTELFHLTLTQRLALPNLLQLPKERTKVQNILWVAIYFFWTFVSLGESPELK